MDAEIAGPERVNVGILPRVNTKNWEPTPWQVVRMPYDTFPFTPPLLLQDIVWKIGLLPLVYLCAYFMFTCYFTRCGSFGRVHQPYFVVFGLLLFNVM